MKKLNENAAVSFKQADYYGCLLEKHGPGVDAIASGQQIFKDLRYKKLSNIFSSDQDGFLIVHDVGCGLGHFYEYLKEKFPLKNLIYSGSEVTPKFVEICQRKFPESSFYLRDLCSGPFPEQCDYLVFGGTFYHLAGSSAHDFEGFVHQMLLNGFASCRKGMAFNFITGFVDYQKEDLFYCDLPNMTDFIVNNLSRFFTIDHATPLYEYTVCVYHEKHISDLYKETDYAKYFKKE
jgi:SAM-dependent methyltransferase